MSLINVNEIDKLKQWASRNYASGTKDVFYGIAEESSFWTLCDNQDNIREFEFCTIPQLASLIREHSNYLESERLDIAIAIASFRLHEKLTETKHEEEKSEIPEFVYVF